MLFLQINVSKIFPWPSTFLIMLQVSETALFLLKEENSIKKAPSTKDSQISLFDPTNHAK